MLLVYAAPSEPVRIVWIASNGAVLHEQTVTYPIKAYLLGGECPAPEDTGPGRAVAAVLQTTGAAGAMPR